MDSSRTRQCLSPGAFLFLNKIGTQPQNWLKILALLAVGIMYDCVVFHAVHPAANELPTDGADKVVM
ncbi:hypothetical protein NZ47_11910 [Anaerovibrio lipolyticus]|uniref:Uncharacterized protein n=1 Tax=Anaerovibrio lipolyticus TaxID=82374 RepID=A0A0B2JW99_9FIRM|nr:hypothetical protein NZ47_11910 [Anaerovibrio lipolyticus]